MRSETFLDAFCRKYGFIKSWIYKSCGFNGATFDYALHERSFSQDEIFRLETFFKEKGRNLLKFQFSEDIVADIKTLRRKFGLKFCWMASQLQISDGSLRSRLSQNIQFSSNDVRLLKYAIADSANALIRLRVSDIQDLKKAA